MDVIEAIWTRRSVGTVRQDMPPRETIEKILEAGTRAPNHRKVEPWRFVVLTGDARKRLGEVDASITAQALPPHLSQEQREEALDTQRTKALRAPVIIVATVDLPASEKVIYIENVAAVAAAVQNMLLTTHALGRAAKWRTGPLAHHPEAKDLFGIAEEQDILGFIYVGYPAEHPPDSSRLPLSERVAWWGDWTDPGTSHQ